MRIPTNQERRRFCEVDGWEELKPTHHYQFRKRLDDGTVWRTRISFGDDMESPSLWSSILRTQLHVSEAEFWAAVEEGIEPKREPPPPVFPSPDRQIEHWLVERLIYSAGYRQDQIAKMTTEDARRCWDLWTESHQRDQSF